MKICVLLTALAYTLKLHAVDYNPIVLEQIQRMPGGGGYAVTREALTALGGAARPAGDTIEISPASATPSFCSGATYLVFLKTLKAAESARHIPPLGPLWNSLVPRPAPDGVGIWGRWNANGPGASRLFHELSMGRSFTSYEMARPGDFMKIFWTDAVGKKERGHLVVFLGTETMDGVEHVRFWSSNKPAGYGEKCVPRSKIARAIFSRLESPENILNAPSLPKKDAYLASLLSTESSFTEALQKSGVRPGQGNDAL